MSTKNGTHSMTDEAYEERRGNVDVLARADIIHMKEIHNVNDRRYEQRFNAIEEASISALASIKEASASALTAQREALSIALIAQKEAALKSETTAEQRFTAIIGQLTVLQQRVDLNLGKGAGASLMWNLLIGAIASFSAVVSIYALLKP